MYIKRSELLKLKESKEYAKINESYKLRLFEKLSEYDVFLSHATKDEEIMQLAKAYFERQNKTVYVAELEDPIATDADETITKEFVRTLQNAMEISASFCYVLSKGGQESTWMPWELGYFDGKYGNKKPIQVLTIYDNMIDDEDKYHGHEYLKLYPHNVEDSIDAILKHQICD